MTPTTTRWCKDINMWTIDRPINPVGDVEPTPLVMIEIMWSCCRIGLMKTRRRFTLN